MSEPPRPVFFRITVGLLALLVLFGVVLAVVLVLNAERINRDGGFAWLMAAFVFVAATTLVSVATAVTSAISLRRGEAHRRLSMVVLIGSLLIVLAFGSGLVRVGWSQIRASQQVASTPQDAQRRANGDGATEIPDSLVEHFRRQGFSIRPALDWASSREWTLDFADVGPRCEVVLRFRGFARAAPRELVDQRLREISVPSVFNEHASLAMFHPFALGTTPDKDACEAWAGKSAGIVEPLLQAFRSYRP